MTETIEHLLELGGTRKKLVCLIISGAALIISLFDVVLLPFDAAWIAIVLCGVPILLEAAVGLITAFDIKADVLVSLALIASVCIGEDFAAGEVAFIMQIGALLEDLTVAKARAGIEKLVHLTPQTARILKDGMEKIIPAKQVKAGDILKVLPGETIPVDGVLTKGQTSVNQAVMTGESLPADKAEGDEVSSGTVNQYGAFEMRALKVGEDSSIQRMIRLVQSADAKKAKIVNLADRWATWIVVIALSASVLTWIISGEIIRAVTILVVFCPCALVLATPTAIMAAIGNATKHGFLVREGDALERLAAVETIAFDKTGTLTFGMPQIAHIYSASDEWTKEDVLGLAASLEQYSEHPLGKAVVRGFDCICRQAENVKILPGLGVCGRIDGADVFAGNQKWLDANAVARNEVIAGLAQQAVLEGCTLIYVAKERQMLGVIALSDSIRPESRQMVSEMKQLAVAPMLLTGDNGNAAKTIAAELGIADVYPNCLPEDKLDIIDRIQQNGVSVCMIGDGVNDAPALKTAFVGIAMGGIGSDIAVDAADIVLVDDEVKELPHLLALSKKMMRVIKWNLAFSMGLNFIAIVLAITGVLNPVVGALVHNAGSVFVIIHSSLLLKWRFK